MFQTYVAGKALAVAVRVVPGDWAAEGAQAAEAACSREQILFCCAISDLAPHV